MKLDNAHKRNTKVNYHEKFLHKKAPQEIDATNYGSEQTLRFRIAPNKTNMNISAKRIKRNMSSCALISCSKTLRLLLTLQSRWLVRHERNTVVKDTLKYRTIEFLYWLRKGVQDPYEIGIFPGSALPKQFIKKFCKRQKCQN